LGEWKFNTISFYKPDNLNSNELSGLKEDKINISWQHPHENNVFRWVVYFKYGNDWNYQILNRKDRAHELKRTSGEKLIPLSRIAVSAVNRVGNESKLAEISGF
jgi:hypothetical protein